MNLARTGNHEAANNMVPREAAGYEAAGKLKTMR